MQRSVRIFFPNAPRFRILTQANEEALDDPQRRRVPSIDPGRPRGLDERRADHRRDGPSGLQAAGRRACSHLRHGPRPGHERPDELSGRPERRAPCGRTEAAPHPRGLGAEAPRGGRRDGRPGRRRDPRRRRDGRGDVVVVRRPGRAERGRPAVFRQHRAPHPARAARRSLPRLRQHRPQGRPLQAPAGPGPRHAAAPRPRDRQRHRRARAKQTAAAYANQAFVKPTIANWGDSELSDYALGFICDMGAPGHRGGGGPLPGADRRGLRRPGAAGPRGPVDRGRKPV